MPQLWLLRHAEAEAHGSRPDAERKLTVRGRTQARRAGRALARIGIGFEGVYASPRVRALDTARLACKPLDIEPIVHQPLNSGFDHNDAAELLATAGADGRILVVGHEPDFSQLVRDLCGARIDLKKGGIAAVGVEGAAAELIVLLRPREIELVASRR